MKSSNAPKVSGNENLCQIYHSEGGEALIKWLTRINVFFIGGNTALLALELLNPLFGFWHALSEGLVVTFSIAGAGML